MSSYNRIPKGSIKISDKKIAFNDRFSAEEEFFKQSSVEEYIKLSKEKIQKEEEEMLLEIQERKQQMLQEGYEEGKKIAVSEAEKTLREEFAQTINEANKVYQDANIFYQNIINQSEEMKNNYLFEKKEEIIDLVLFAVKETVHQAVEKELVDIDKIYNEALSKIYYDTKKIFVRVHPTTHELLARTTSIKKDKRVVFLYDLNLELSDFIIETEREFIDLSIQTQLEEMKEYLRGVLDA